MLCNSMTSTIMKRTLLITAFCVLFFFIKVSAQSKTTYAFGVKSGINLSHLTERVVVNKFLFSYLGGVSLEQRFSPRISLSYELLYSRQGDISYFTNPGLYNRVRTRYNYVILPIELRYRLKHYPVYINPGFQAGYLVYKRGDFLPTNGSITNSSNQEKK